MTVLCPVQRYFRVSTESTDHSRLHLDGDSLAAVCLAATSQQPHQQSHNDPGKMLTVAASPLHRVWLDLPSDLGRLSSCADRFTVLGLVGSGHSPPASLFPVLLLACIFPLFGREEKAVGAISSCGVVPCSNNTCFNADWWKRISSSHHPA